MEQHVRTLGRENLSELESVERLVTSIGPEAFEADVRRLSNLYTLDPESAIQSISRLTHPLSRDERDTLSNFPAAV